MKALSRVRRRQLLLGVAALLPLPGAARAAAPIVLGHSYPASGIFADTAAEMKAAIDAAAASANAEGGIAGRALRVVSLDDGYEPSRTLDNAERLRRDAGAVALVAPVGAPNLAALMPWAARSGVPVIGARSGADAQRSYHPQVFFNIASFGDEVRHVARHLHTIGVRRVAVAAMNNATGHDIQQLFMQEAAAHRLDALEPSLFDPAGTNAADVAWHLAEQQPKAVLLAGGGLGATRLVEQLLSAGVPAPALYALSLLQPAQLLRQLGARCHGVVFTQVMPSLDDTRVPLVLRYRQALERLPQARASQFGLEGFLAMRITLRALAAAAPAPDSRTLTRTLEALGTTDIDGFRIQYDRRSHHGTRFVELGILSRGRMLR